MRAEPMQGDDITTGEIGRRLDALSRTVEAMADKLDTRPDWHDLNRMEDAQKEREQAQDKALKALQDSYTWLFRTAGTALIAGLAGLLFDLRGGA